MNQKILIIFNSDNIIFTKNAIGRIQYDVWILLLTRFILLFMPSQCPKYKTQALLHQGVFIVVLSKE